MLRFAITLAVVMVTACGMFGFGATPVPTASATLHWKTLDLPRGSYCWSSAGQGICADSPGPDLLLEHGDLKPYRTAGGFDARVKFHSSSTLKRFEVLLMRRPSGNPIQVTMNGSDTFPVAMSPPAQAGIYVYVIRGTWAEGSVDFFLAIDLIPGAA